MKRWLGQACRLGLCLGVLSLLSSTPFSFARPSSYTAFSLRADDSVFWDGPLSSTSSEESWVYKLNVTERAFRLRIGIDHPEVGDVYSVVITSPSGDVLPTFSPGSGLYSAEAFVRDPEIGKWDITVRADEVSDSAFRMRAKLEATRYRLRSGPILPNLQVLPPHLPSFLMPITNGSTDDDPTGVDVGGRESCHPEEHAEDGAIRCLRFGFGVRNTGNGPLHLIVGPGIELQDRQLIQRIEYGDGSHVDRPAGQAKFHKTHGHYHHDAAIGLRLYRDTATGAERLQPAGPLRTKGFAHREELLRDWEQFYPTWDPVPFGLRAGWADIYEWDRPGNYIDLGLNPDGRYVIRMWADPVEQILESNEKDNVAYAYLEVKGSSAELLEVGRGRDPWDRCKIIVGPGGYPDPKRNDARPGNCPPDTT